MKHAAVPLVRDPSSAPTVAFPTPSTMSLQPLNTFLRHPSHVGKGLASSADDLRALLLSFIERSEAGDVGGGGEDGDEGEGKRGGSTDLTCLVRLVREGPVQEAQERLLLPVLQVFKILFREHDNRCAIGELGVASIVDALGSSCGDVAREAANVVLNMCYHSANVDHILDAGAMAPLLQLLLHDDPEIQASACGALQSICFQPLGRVEARDLGAIPLVVALLESAERRVLVRACGAMHNLSSDKRAVGAIRKAQGVLPLVGLLRSPYAVICASASGALQNISREVASRRLLLEHGAVAPLLDLLFSSDVQTQASAAGALLNIVGPDLGEDTKGDERCAFKRMISDCIALGTVWNCYTEAGDDTSGLELDWAEIRRETTAAALKSVSVGAKGHHGVAVPKLQGDLPVVPVARTARSPVAVRQDADGNIAVEVVDASSVSQSVPPSLSPNG